MMEQQESELDAARDLLVSTKAAKRCPYHGYLYVNDYTDEARISAIRIGRWKIKRGELNTDSAECPKLSRPHGTT